jgi:hypothetical protein
MKHNWLSESSRPGDEVIATFGGAEIVKRPEGRLDIRGGTEQEKAQAHDWMKQFLTQGPLTVKRLR